MLQANNIAPQNPGWMDAWMNGCMDAWMRLLKIIRSLRPKPV
jgi:hypothetical protein